MDAETDLYRDLARPSQARMILLVVGGLTVVPSAAGGATPLELARAPALDELARQGVCGLHEAVAPGITPGRGTALAALLGYDPQRYTVGRGVLAALGTGIELGTHDVAAAGRFVTVADDQTVADRDAGYPDFARTEALCALLTEQVLLAGADCTLRAFAPNRFALVLRGSGLSGEVEDTDPGDGEALGEVRSSSAAGRRTARLVGNFVALARDAMHDQGPANGLLLNGFSRRPAWPTLEEQYGLRAAAITECPLARGVARLAGLTLIAADPGLEGALSAAARQKPADDLLVVHWAPPEGPSADNVTERAVRWIEQVDACLPALRALGAEVVVVTGDRTSLGEGGAGWQPVPVVLGSPRCRADDVTTLSERACAHGALGPRYRTADLLPLMLANALRLGAFGA